MKTMTLDRIARTNNVDAALRAGRNRSPIRPAVVVQTWLVRIFVGGEFINGDVIGGEPFECIVITCEEGKFGAAMRKAGYDVTDLTMEYTRELISSR